MHAVKFVERESERDLEIELGIEEMGRKLNLSHLNEDECKHILEVIQRDFKLRQNEAQRVGKIQDDINQEHAKDTILSKQKKFNQSYCMRCFSTFFFIFNRRIQCINCGFNVCKDCAKCNEKSKEWKCTTCISERNLKEQSCEWFYKQIKSRFRRFGSAKVVRSLYKRKVEESDQSNSDSGYDHNNMSPLSSMYGSNVTLPREKDTKDSSTNTSDSDSDSDSTSDSDSDPRAQSFHTVCQELERMVVQLQQPEDIGESIAKFSIGVQVPKDAVREVEGLVLDATDGSGRCHSRRRGKHHRRRHFIRDDGSSIVGSIPSPIEEQISPPIETLPRLDESDAGTPLVNGDDRAALLESPKKVRFSETPTYVEPSSPEEGGHLSPIKEDITMNSAPPPDVAAAREEDGIKDERFMHGLRSGKEAWPRGEVLEGGENGGMHVDVAVGGSLDEDTTDGFNSYSASSLTDDHGRSDAKDSEVNETVRREREISNHENPRNFQPNESVGAQETEISKRQGPQTLKSKSDSLESTSSSSADQIDRSDSIETHFPSESSQSNVSTPATPPPSRASDESNNDLNDSDDIEAELQLHTMSTSTSSETVKSEGYYTPEDIKSPDFMQQLQKFTRDNSDESLSKSEWDKRSLAASEYSTDSNLEYLTPLSETEPFGLYEHARIDEELLKSEQLLQEISDDTLTEEKEAIDRVVKEVIESLVNYVVAMSDRLDAVSMETVAKTIVKSSPTEVGERSTVHEQKQELSKAVPVSFQSDEIPSPYVNGEMSQECEAVVTEAIPKPVIEEATEFMDEPVQMVSVSEVESMPQDLPDVVKEQVHQQNVLEDAVMQDTIDPLEQYFIGGDGDAVSDVPSVQREAYANRTPLPGILPQVRDTRDIENDINSDVSDHYEISLEETVDNEPVMRLNICDQRLLPEYSDDDVEGEDMLPPSYESAVTGQHLKDLYEEPEHEIESDAEAKRAAFGRIPTIEITEPVKSPDAKKTSPPPEVQADVTLVTQQQIPDVVESNHHDNGHGDEEEESGGSESSISRSPTLEILELEKREKAVQEQELNSEPPSQFTGEAAARVDFEFEKPVRSRYDYGDLLYHSPSDEKNGNYIGSLLAAEEDHPSPTDDDVDVTEVDGHFAAAAEQIPEIIKTAEEPSANGTEKGDAVFSRETSAETHEIEHEEKLIEKKMVDSVEASVKDEPVVNIGPLTSESLRRLSEHSQDEDYGLNGMDDRYRIERLSPRHTLHHDDLGADSDSVRSIASSTVASGSDLDYLESGDEDEILHKSSSDEDDLDFYAVAGIYEDPFKRAAGGVMDVERTHRPTPPPSPKSSPKKKESLEIANLTKKVSLKQGEVLDSAEDVLTSANQMRELHEQVDQLEACISKLENEVIGRQTSQESNVSYTDTSFSIHPRRQVSMESSGDGEIEKQTKRPQEQLVDDVQALEEELLEATVDNSENEQSAASAVRMITDTVLKVITSTEKFISDEQAADAIGDDGEEDLGRLHISEDSGDDSASKKDENGSWMDIKLEVLEPDILAPEPIKSRIASSKVQEEVANIEERVYMSAGKVFSLEERMKQLEGQVDEIDQNSPEQQLVDLEDKVALAIAQVAQSEQQVLSVQERIADLNRASGGSIGAKYTTQYSLDSSLPKQDGGSPSSLRATDQKSWRKWVPQAAAERKPEVPTSLPLADRDDSFKRGGFVRSSQRKSATMRWRPAEPSTTEESGAAGGSEIKPVEAEREEVMVRRRGSVKGIAAMFERQSSGESVSSDSRSGESGSTRSQSLREGSDGRRGEIPRQRPYKGSINRTQYYLEKKPQKVQIYTSLR